MTFMFEDLIVYKMAMEFVIKIYTACDAMKPPKKFKLIDQLERAALSIPLNIAEGNGRAHFKEKRQYFHIARGSLLECIPIISLCKEIKLISSDEYSSLYELAENISRALSGLIKHFDR